MLEKLGFRSLVEQTVTSKRIPRAMGLHLRSLFVAVKIWRHAGRTGVSYSSHYEEKAVFQRLMDRLRRITPRAHGHAPVTAPALR